MITKLHTQSEQLADLVSNYIKDARSLDFYYSGLDYFKFTPEMQVMTALETRMNFSIMADRTWLDTKVKVKGVRLTISYPCLLMANGNESREFMCLSSTQELIASLDHHRPRKPLPFAFDDPKAPVVFLDSSCYPVRSNTTQAEWTDPARPIAAINAFLKRLGISPLDTPEGNQLLADMDEVVAAARVSVRWLDEKPSHIYSNDGGSPYSSCMSGEPEEWFEIYDDFYMEDRLKMVGLFRGEERVGRAICWVGENPDEMYLDRVYAPGHRSTFDNDVVEELKQFCKDNGVAKTVFPQTADYFALEYVSRFRTRVPRLKDPDDYGNLPYLDSLRFHSYEGWLHTYEPNGNYATLTNTDGSAEGRDDDTTLITAGSREGDRVDDDDAVYIDRYGETYHVDDTTYSARIHDRVVDEDSVEHYSGEYIWEGDAILLHDGRYADTHDDLTELSGGDGMALTKDTITLHDGSVYITDDIDYISTVDGDYALPEDCVEVDGVWYLAGDEPQPDEETETETATVA